MVFFIINIENAYKVEETSDGSVRITREVCKSCKLGNKLIGSLVRNVQYGRPPIYQKDLVKKVPWKKEMENVMEEDAMEASTSKAGRIEHLRFSDNSDVFKLKKSSNV